MFLAMCNLKVEVVFLGRDPDVAQFLRNVWFLSGYMHCWAAFLLMFYCLLHKVYICEWEVWAKILLNNSIYVYYQRILVHTYQKQSLYAACVFFVTLSADVIIADARILQHRNKRMTNVLASENRMK